MKNAADQKLISTFALSIFLFSFNTGGWDDVGGVGGDGVGRGGGVCVSSLFRSSPRGFFFPFSEYHLHTRILYRSCKSLFSLKKKNEKERKQLGIFIGESC